MVYRDTQSGDRCGNVVTVLFFSSKKHSKTGGDTVGFFQDQDVKNIKEPCPRHSGDGTGVGTGLAGAAVLCLFCVVCSFEAWLLDVCRGPSPWANGC